MVKNLCALCGEAVYEFEDREGKVIKSSSKVCDECLINMAGNVRDLQLKLDRVKRS